MSRCQGWSQSVRGISSRRHESPNICGKVTRVVITLRSSAFDFECVNPRYHTAYEAGQQPPRGRTDDAVAGRLLGRLPQRFPGQQPPEPSVSRERLLPGGGAVPAIRAGGCHENAGQLPPREGGCWRRFLPDSRAASASVGRLLRRSRVGPTVNIVDGVESTTLVGRREGGN